MNKPAIRNPINARRDERLTKMGCDMTSLKPARPCSTCGYDKRHRNKTCAFCGDTKND